MELWRLQLTTWSTVASTYSEYTHRLANHDLTFSMHKAPNKYPPAVLAGLASAKSSWASAFPEMDLLAEDGVMSAEVVSEAFMMVRAGAD